MAKGKIGVTTENIFPVIKKFLYSDHAGTGHRTLIPYFFKTLCILNWNRKSGIAETIFMNGQVYLYPFTRMVN